MPPAQVFVTLMFITDIFFNFNTAYLEGTNYVIDRTMIAKNYVKSWFVIDALSSFPVELVDLFTASAQAAAAAAGEETDNTLVKGLRALRMVRLLRMMKLLKMQQYIDDLEDRSGMNMQILQIFKMVCLMLYLMHLLGCFWFYVATNVRSRILPYHHCPDAARRVPPTRPVCALPSAEWLRV